MNKKSTILIETSELSFKVRSKWILDHVSLTVEENDFITIVGPNGAGKTTLLKLILGITKPTKGSVTKHSNLRIGYVPQRFTPDPILPINVEYFLSLSPNYKKENLKDIFKLSQIDHLLKNDLYTLSGGEMQRVLMARAMLNDPNLLILDEPAQNLDISGQLNLYKLIQNIHQERKCAILMVSHDLHMVMAQTNQVYCLYHHICCSGKAEQVMKDQKFLDIFGDDFAKMMTVYQHHHTHEHD